MLLDLFLAWKLCVSNTWFRRKVILRMGKNEREIDIVLIKKEH